MTVAIEDKKVLLDDVTENIESIEEFVQSVTVRSIDSFRFIELSLLILFQVASMNKI